VSTLGFNPRCDIERASLRYSRTSYKHANGMGHSYFSYDADRGATHRGSFNQLFSTFKWNISDTSWSHFLHFQLSRSFCAFTQGGQFRGHSRNARGFEAECAQTTLPHTLPHQLHTRAPIGITPVMQRATQSWLCAHFFFSSQSCKDHHPQKERDAE